MHFEHLPYNLYIEEGKKILHQYLETCEWLSELGIPQQKTRLGNYKNTILNFERCFEGNIGEAEAKARMDNFMNAYGEAIDLIRIKINFDSLDCRPYLAKFKAVTSGQPFRNQEKHDGSRDYAFELSMAARFLQGGYTVDLTQIADLVVTTDKIRIYVECKRITSPKKFDVRLKEANKQLRRRLSNDVSPHCRGLVAVNLTDIINPSNSYSLARSGEELHRQHSARLEEYVLGKQHILRKESFKRCIGVLCEATTQAYLPVIIPPAVCNCRGIKFYHKDLKASDEALVRALAASIANQRVTK